MSTATVSSAVPSFYTSNGVTRLNGSEFASGLDTQNLIKALTADITSRIDKQKQMEQKASWRRDAYRAVEDLLQKFSDTYLSYSTNSTTNIMSAAFFDSESLISSNSSIVTATGAQSDAGNVEIESIENLATAASYNGSAVSHTSIVSTAVLGSTISSGSYLNVSVGGTKYTLSLGANIDTTGKSAKDIASEIKDDLNKAASKVNDAIKAATGLEGEVKFASDDAGKITLTGASVTGASANFGKGLGTEQHNGDVTTYDMSTMQVTDASISKLNSLSDQLAGTTLTVQLNGVTKTISFDKSESAQYSDAAGIATYLQGKMTDAFGKDASGNSKVSVTNDGGKLTIQTSGSDTTSIVRLASASSSGVLDMDGLLHIRSGETNRLETDKTLGDLVQSNELLTPLSSSFTMKDKDNNDITAYKFSINGKEFSFDKNTELNTVINTINNDPTANVTVSYSQTLNRFRIVSDDTGSQGKIDFYDEGNSNLTAALFGGSTVLCSGDMSTAPTVDTSANYSITLGNGSAQSISVTRNAGQTVSAFATSVQTAINSNSTLKDKITVGVSTDGKSLTFKTTDGSSALKIASDNPAFGFNSDGQTVTAVTAGTDLSMKVKLSGGEEQTISRSTNSFTLDGVALSVNGTLNSTITPNADGRTDGPIKFSASNDIDDLYKKVSDFVDQYNAIIALVNTDVTTLPTTNSTSNGGGTSYEPLTDDQKKTMTDTEITEWNKKAQQGLLFCDPQMSALQSDIRQAMEDNVDSTDMSLAGIGIATAPYDTQSGGKLIISKDDLTKALKDNPDKVKQLFTNSDGIASRLKSVLNNNIGAFGTSGALFDVAGSSTSVGADNSQIGNEIRDYDTRIKDLQTQLKDQQDTLQKKFTYMETIISQLSTQYSYIQNMSST